MTDVDEIQGIEKHLKKQDDVLIVIKEHLGKHDRIMAWTSWFSVACIGISVVILGQAFRLGQQEFDPLSAQIIDGFLFAIGISIVGYAVIKYKKQENSNKIKKLMNREEENMEVESSGELLHKLEEWRKEDKRLALAGKFENLAYISWGFTLAMV